MQQRIVVLGEDVANKIAAGEVIERPASVVKELVENALDAGATRVEIELKNGGKDYIKVVDDGSGIHPEDVPLAFERHATSKIRQAEDLFHITTLGFRGEALPSIAAVSELEMVTKPATEPAATRITFAGGKRYRLEPAGAPPGTTVIVKRLFYNTPARYKFLKQPATERRYILDVVSRLALAHAEIRFRLLEEGQELLATPGDGELLSVMRGIYGRRIARNLLPLQGSASGIEVRGFICKPDIHKGTRKEETFVVNGRTVESHLLASALEKGYQTLLPRRRFPIAVVMLTIDPERIDVNVHPAKTEVRFEDSSSVYKQVMLSVRQALREAELFTRWESEPAQSAFPSRKSSLSRGEKRSAGTPSGIPGHKASRTSFFSSRSASKTGPLPSTSGSLPCSPGAVSSQESDGQSVVSQEPVYDPVPEGESESQTGFTLSLKQVGSEREANRWAEQESEPKKSSGQLMVKEEPSTGHMVAVSQEGRILGQFDRTYILWEKKGNLWLIDQHAAHERVLYERFMQQLEKNEIPVQNLLTPIYLDVSPREAVQLLEAAHRLASFGFGVESFGLRDCVVRSLPVELAGTGPGELAELLLAIVQEANQDYREASVTLMACKAAVKAGQPLSPAVMEQLVRDLMATENPFTCPHGRPAAICLSGEEVARRFRRR